MMYAKNECGSMDFLALIICTYTRTHQRIELETAAHMLKMPQIKARFEWKGRIEHAVWIEEEEAKKKELKQDD